MKRSYFLFTSIIFLASILFVASFAQAEIISLKTITWPFEGIFGAVDRRAAQRGFQVYKEVCASCHSMDHVHYRDLNDLGFSPEEIKQIASQYNILDGPDNAGKMFERAALPTDKFIGPYKNSKEAMATNNGALPPDLSLIIKARHNGPNYVYSLLTGYKDPPDGFKLSDGLYYNQYFSGHQIAMPPPLIDGCIQYQDGTDPTVSQMARDLVIFLQWCAEPEMERRKALGLSVMVFLLIFTTLFYLVKKRIWRDIHK